MSTEEKYANWGLSLSSGKAFGSGIVSAAESLGLYADPEELLPTGTTAADKCGSCFTIHSPGQTECW